MGPDAYLETNPHPKMEGLSVGAQGISKYNAIPKAALSVSSYPYSLSQYQGSRILISQSLFREAMRFSFCGSWNYIRRKIWIEL